MIVDVAMSGGGWGDCADQGQDGEKGWPTVGGRAGGHWSLVGVEVDEDAEQSCYV